MIVAPIKTDKILPKQLSLTALLDKCVEALNENSILVITSKIVSLCQGQFVGLEANNKDELIKKESDLYLLPESNKYHHHFSIINNTIVGSAGIDASNAAGTYALWPADAQKTANEIRQYLKDRFSLQMVGVIITDSISIPLRRGAVGTSIAHSGFEALKDYRGTQDLFGHEFQVSVGNIVEGLAAAATVSMGEGTEQTPLAVISDLPFVNFVDRDPTQAEIADLRLNIDEDLFGIFLKNAPWQKGDKSDQIGTP